ncbi:alpha/beta hydrolase [Persicitalea jodogahamensis]|uniref:Tributyrin esterase n=1 Tax=Persicitalea jodogahamensis TaxID=402147 RepID=A0A8J3D5K6_9BACT|nr:alpha/beta hydrolase-fold protein [Persicitalea jodogahamensis]GHB78247.1 tributyrin esterase [Persicitalea jodogahamensis]
MAHPFRTLEVSDPRFSNEGVHYITVKTPNLQGRGDISVFLPRKISCPLPLVILLHGVYGSHWAWTMKAGVHQTAQRLIDENRIKPIALAMPSDGLFGDGSGYLPHSGHNFEKWILDDVPAAVEAAFPSIEFDPDAYFIAGLSMGGYGAMRLGARFPQRFRGFAGHSSITELEQMSQFVEESVSDYAQNEPRDASVLAQLVKNKNFLPPFRFDCGLQDSLLDANRALHEKLLEHHIPHEYQEFPGGHEWDYWEKYIEKTLLFFDHFR